MRLMVSLNFTVVDIQAVNSLLCFFFLFFFLELNKENKMFQVDRTVIILATTTSPPFL